MNNQSVQCTLKKESVFGTRMTVVWVEETKLKNTHNITLDVNESPWKVHEIFNGIKR